MNSLQPILDFYRARGGAAAWRQGSCAGDEEGNTVGVSDPQACQWCPYGVAALVSPSSCSFVDGPVVRELLRRVGRDYAFGKWNDAPERTWEEVEAMLSMEDAA